MRLIVTYKGDRPIISNRIAMLITDMALTTASFIMAKISQILSILSFIISASMLGGGYFGYKYVTSPQFKNRMMNEVLANVQQMMPKILDKQIPKTTSGSIPLPMK